VKHFFDVGANVGQTFDDYLIPRAADFADHVIWCFEPSPRHLPALMEKAHSSVFNVRICPFGLGGRTSAPVFFQKDDPRGDSFSPHLASDHVTANLLLGYTLHGAVFAAGEFILAHTAPDDRITLKLDCEGSEYALLQALLLERDALARIENILVEWHTIEPRPELDAAELEFLYAQIGHPLGRWMF
jgi:FkbM family methyltransferase